MFRLANPDSISNLLFYLFFEKINCTKMSKWGLGIGDWGLGIGDWGLGPIPNPQSPIPNPQSPYTHIYIYIYIYICIYIFSLFSNSHKYLIKNNFICFYFNLK